MHKASIAINYDYWTISCLTTGPSSGLHVGVF